MPGPPGVGSHTIQFSLSSMPLQTSSARQAPPSGTIEGASRSRWRAILRSPLWMVADCLRRACRLDRACAHLSHSHHRTQLRLRLGDVGRIAYSLANGMGFSSPFGGNTGPSAWTAPVLSLDRVAGLPRLRQLLAGLGLRSAHLQQCLRRAHLLDHLPHRAPRLQSARSRSGRAGCGRCIPTRSSGR